MTARHVWTAAGPGVAVALALVALTTAAGCSGPSVSPAAPSATLADVAIAPTTTACPPLQRTPTPTSLPGAATHLVPFAPTSVLLCVYDPLGGGATPAQSLVASRNVTDAMRARQVRDRIDQAAKPWPAGPINCPADRGTVLDAYFRKGIVEQVEVEIGTTGCAGATNGTLVVMVGEAVPYLEDIVPFPSGLR